MYNIFIFNFTFKCNFNGNYHVYKFYPGCRTLLGCWSPVFDILMYTILFTIAYLYDYCIYLCIERLINKNISYELHHVPSSTIRTTYC